MPSSTELEVASAHGTHVGKLPAACFSSWDGQSWRNCSDLLDWQPLSLLWGLGPRHSFNLFPKPSMAMGLVWACGEVNSSASSFSNSSRSKKKLAGCLWGLDDITDIKHFVNSKGSSIWLLLSQMWIWFCLVIKLIWRKYWSRVFLCGNKVFSFVVTKNVS